jgi:tight adherence protein B
MYIALISSLFITTFLSLLLVTSRKQKEEEIEKKEQPSVSGLLKKGNDKIKLMLTKKKKPTKKRDSLRSQLSVAGILMKPEEFIAMQWIISLILAGLGYLVTELIWFMLLSLVIGFLMPKAWLNRKRNSRVKKFSDALPGMITSIISSLRAGFSFVQSLQLVGEESPSPVKEEVQLVLKAMQYGTSIEDALLEWKNRMPSKDLDLLVEAILVQRQVGGNLAYLLEKIVETIRERIKLENQIKTLTAQGRLSGVIISGLPVALGILIYLMNPAYIMTLFTNPIGQVLVGIAVVGGIIGFILIKKITTIEV